MNFLRGVLYVIRYTLYKLFANFSRLLLAWVLFLGCAVILYWAGYLKPNEYPHSVPLLLITFSGAAFLIVAVIGLILRIFEENDFGCFLVFFVPLLSGWSVWFLTDAFFLSFEKTRDWFTFSMAYVPGFLSYVCVLIYVIMVVTSKPPRLEKVHVPELEKSFTDPSELASAVNASEVSVNFVGPLRIAISPIAAVEGLGAKYTKVSGGYHWEYKGNSFWHTRNK
jgi:hypothetical protein